MSAWRVRLGYLLFLIAPVAILTKALASKRFPGWFIYPDYFGLFKFLFHLQEALLVGLIVAAIALLTTRVARVWLRFLVYLPISLAVVWFIVWAAVRAAFTIELSPSYAAQILIDPSSVRAVGLSPTLFYPEVALLFLVIFAVAAAGEYLSGRIGIPFANRVALLFLGIFLLVHIPVRAYVAYHVNCGQRAVLALDDWTPLALRTEYLLPGLREHRPALPNLEDPNRTRAYIDWMKKTSMPPIPHQFDIVWIIIESFRADAMSERATPYLWSHASEFQIKLDRNHWSSGNATKFGVFSMLTGISAYHLPTFIHQRLPSPFLNLLAQNGYRIRIAKENYFQYGGLRSFFPASSVSAKMRDAAADETDTEMMNALLTDRNKRTPAPSLDIVTFDATHWPFFYRPEDDQFEPAASNLDATHLTRTPAEANKALNRFRNASHFVDRQIGRIMEDLRAHGALEHTIVIVAGDHGEEFMERGQVFHSGAMDDYQGRPVLWMHLPGAPVSGINANGFTSHVDIVPTLLDLLGFDADVLRTQGQSLLHPRNSRKALLVGEQGYDYPFYNALVTNDYISRWRNTARKFDFSGVVRRDGQPVIGNNWLEQATAEYPQAAQEYENLPDPTPPPLPFRSN
jgi:membrane-anchored protein YejM (alkaline phosphatase superfamily)